MFLFLNFFRVSGYTQKILYVSLYLKKTSKNVLVVLFSSIPYMCSRKETSNEYI